MKIILASGSPRRHLLLNMIGLAHEVIPSSVDEVIPDGLDPSSVARHLARLKGEDVAVQHPHTLIIAADTIVVLDGEILGKPASAEDAFSMLRRLSDNTHRVITGVALLESDSDGIFVKESVFHVTSDVTFANLHDEEIWAYIATGSPMDKAGSYGIQDDLGSLFVSRIEGCYYNVVGLPVQHLYSTLKDVAPGVASGILSTTGVMKQR